MSLTSILTDAVRALRDKIASSAGSASPEDLAYMAKALESIGGRVSLIEVEDYAQQKIIDMTTAAATLTTGLQATQTAAVFAVNNAAAASANAMFLTYATSGR